MQRVEAWRVDLEHLAGRGWGTGVVAKIQQHAEEVRQGNVTKQNHGCRHPAREAQITIYAPDIAIRSLVPRPRPEKSDFLGRGLDTRLSHSQAVASAQRRMACQNFVARTALTQTVSGAS